MDVSYIHSCQKAEINWNLKLETIYLKYFQEMKYNILYESLQYKN
jgi:hypothetical protein